MAHPYQTDVQNIDTVRFGSAQIAITGTLGATANTTYWDLGVAQGIIFKEEIMRAWIGGDNAEPEPRVIKQRAIISGTLIEYGSSAWEMIRGNIDIYTTETGAYSSTKRTETGGLRAQDAFQVRLINSIVTTTSATRTLEILAWECYDNSALEFAFQPDEDENPMGVPFEFIAMPDTTRAVGSQLYRIKDSQSTS